MNWVIHRDQALRLIALLRFVWKIRRATTVIVFAWPMDGVSGKKELGILQLMPRQADYGASKRHEEWFRAGIRDFATNQLGDDTRVFRV